MTTRALIIIRDLKNNNVITLYKHSDGYGSYMQELFKLTYCFLTNIEKSYLPHHITLPETIAATLIVTDFLNYAYLPKTMKMSSLVKPDLRPIDFDKDLALEVIETAKSNSSNEVVFKKLLKMLIDYVYILEIRGIYLEDLPKDFNELKKMRENLPEWNVKEYSIDFDSKKLVLQHEFRICKDNCNNVPEAMLEKLYEVSELLTKLVKQ